MSLVTRSPSRQPEREAARVSRQLVSTAGMRSPGLKRVREPSETALARSLRAGPVQVRAEQPDVCFPPRVPGNTFPF